MVLRMRKDNTADIKDNLQIHLKSRHFYFYQPFVFFGDDSLWWWYAWEAYYRQLEPICRYIGLKKCVVTSTPR